MVVCEPLYDLLQSRVIMELEAVPERPLSGSILILRSSNRLRKTEERQRKINETVLVILEFVFCINNLMCSV